MLARWCGQILQLIYTHVMTVKAKMMMGQGVLIML